MRVSGVIEDQKGLRVSGDDHLEVINVVGLIEEHETIEGLEGLRTYARRIRRQTSLHSSPPQPRDEGRCRLGS